MEKNKYTIKDAARIMGVPTSTIRYYDKGFTAICRTTGIRISDFYRKRYCYASYHRLSEKNRYVYQRDSSVQQLAGTRRLLLTAEI